MTIVVAGLTYTYMHPYPIYSVFFNVFFSAYLINPKICHSLVGYIEEEAVKTVSPPTEPTLPTLT